jgi:hypothetical protein
MGLDQCFLLQAEYHTSWGSQMFMSLHICTSSTPKESLIYHAWLHWHTPTNDKTRVPGALSCLYPDPSLSQCLYYLVYSQHCHPHAWAF